MRKLGNLKIPYGFLMNMKRCPNYVFWALPLFILTSGCESKPPPALSMASVRWVTYKNENVGYTLQYPVAYTLQNSQTGRDILFRHNGFPAMAINYTTKGEADERGLWADHKAAGEIKLASQSGKQYIYNHYDGPFYMRTVSYVIILDSKFLALEFRTQNEKADSLQQHILDSFALSR